VSCYFKCRVVFLTALLLIIFPINSFSSGLILENDGLILDKATKKMQEMGRELYQKSGVTTVIVAKQSMSRDEFLALKNRYMRDLKKKYVIWLFSKATDNSTLVGLNKIFTSSDLKDRLNIDSILGSLFTRGSFTSVYVVHNSKVDPTSAAFLNGYADMVDMLASSYNIELDSSIGSQSKTSIDIIRSIFYIIVILAMVVLVRNKFRYKK
jgi:hypothetical protein